MHKKSEVEFERFRIAKITRALTRLEYSVLADKAINDILPDRLKEFDKALQSGELKTIPDDALDIKNWEPNAGK